MKTHEQALSEAQDYELNMGLAAWLSERQNECRYLVHPTSGGCYVEIYRGPDICRTSLPSFTQSRDSLALIVEAMNYEQRMAMHKEVAAVYDQRYPRGSSEAGPIFTLVCEVAELALCAAKVLEFQCPDNPQRRG